MQPYAVFIDLDGTLICGSYTPSRENLLAIDRVRALGHKVFINTGRSAANIPPEIMTHAARFDGIVSGNGSHVSLGGEVIRSVCFSEALLNRLCDYFFENPGDSVLFEGTRELFAIQWDDFAFSNINPKKVTRENDFRTAYRGAEISTVAIEGSVTRRFKETFRDELTIFDFDGYADCAIKGCDKAVGMEVVLKAAGIPLERAIAIGDGANDGPMLALAAIGVAMGNAAQELKRIADDVTVTNREHGVARTLEKYLMDL
ncbi:MAG: Cof-type HAD-IIB family hydrolase [Oscillospiraceae bacterium]|nr:Cof-type HAD-IIB family hydrolase [Oscillospiraceae bacterium]